MHRITLIVAVGFIRHDFLGSSRSVTLQLEQTVISFHYILTRFFRTPPLLFIFRYFCSANLAIINRWRWLRIWYHWQEFFHRFHWWRKYASVSLSRYTYLFMSFEHWLWHWKCVPTITYAFWVACNKFVWFYSLCLCLFFFFFVFLCLAFASFLNVVSNMPNLPSVTSEYIIQCVDQHPYHVWLDSTPFLLIPTIYLQIDSSIHDSTSEIFFSICLRYSVRCFVQPEFSCWSDNDIWAHYVKPHWFIKLTTKQ